MDVEVATEIKETPTATLSPEDKMMKFLNDMKISFEQ